jgi:O-antigen/teichoic acid export membrane protein
MDTVGIIKNIVANYIGRGATIVFGILFTPLYLHYLGAESFGLIGFFILIQSWAIVMDMGLSPTLGRQVASAREDIENFQSLYRLLRSFEVIFVFLAGLVALIIGLSSNWLATEWIKAENLDREIIVYCICLMALMVGFRWFSSLYRSGLNGFEDQVWVNQATVLFLFLRYCGSLTLLAVFSADVTTFFEFQLLNSVFEIFIMGSRLYQKLPRPRQSQRFIFFDWAEVKAVMPFALGVSYSAILWILVTQSDRLILSGLLSLAEFGYLTLVLLVTSGITIISEPVGVAVRPRMTLLFAQKKQTEFVLLYRTASRFVTWLALSLAIIVGLNAETLLYAFSGNRDAADWGGEVLIWFAFGSAFLAASAYQYYLQTAIGDLKLHVIGASVGAAIQVPVVVFVAVNYGAVGAGISWLGLRLMFFLFWTPIVHKRFLPGFHVFWFVRDILPILIVVSLVGFFLSANFPVASDENRALALLKLLGLGFLHLLITFSILLGLDKLGGDQRTLSKRHKVKN